LPETGCERQFFFFVSQLTEQAEHVIHASSSSSDYPQGGIPLGMAGAHTFQQDAFEFAAVAGPVSVNAAFAPLERGTGLREFQSGADGARTGGWETSLQGISAAHADEGQAKRSQMLRIIVCLQSHIGKDHAVAAHAAHKTQAFGRRPCGCIFW
jgi:hypothetical protein